MRSLCPLGLVLVLAGPLAGCRDEAPSTPPATSAAVGASASTQPPRAEPYAHETLPDEADYASDAEKEISNDNFSAKLAELERDIAEGEAAIADAGTTAPPPPPAPTSGASTR